MSPQRHKNRNPSSSASFRFTSDTPHAGREISGFRQNAVLRPSLFWDVMLCSIPDDDTFYYVSITSLF